MMTNQATNSVWNNNTHKIIIMNRVCVNTLCIMYRKQRSEEVGKFFAKVYDVALDYAQRLRVKAITNIKVNGVQKDFNGQYTKIKFILNLIINIVKRFHFYIVE